MSDFPEINTLLPHGPGFLLLDRVVLFEDSRVLCSLKVDSKLILGELRGKVPAWVAVEYMAQAAAACGGLKSAEVNKAPAAGVVLGTKKMDFFRDVFFEGESLLVSARLEYAEDPLRVFDCELWDRGGATLWVRGEMKIYLS